MGGITFGVKGCRSTLSLGPTNFEGTSPHSWVNSPRVVIARGGCRHLAAKYVGQAPGILSTERHAGLQYRQQATIDSVSDEDFSKTVLNIDTGDDRL